MKTIVILFAAALTATATAAKPSTGSRRHVTTLPAYVVAEPRYSAPSPADVLADAKKESAYPVALPAIQVPHFDDLYSAPGQARPTAGASKEPTNPARHG
jgi:hypothetical protein